MVGRGFRRGLNTRDIDNSKIFRIEFEDPDYDFGDLDVDLDVFLGIYDLSNDSSIVGGGILSLEEKLLFLDVDHPYGSRLRGRKGHEEVEDKYDKNLPNIRRVYRTDPMRGRGYFSDPRRECPDPV